MPSPTIFNRYISGQTNWETLDMLPDRGLQSAELNEIQRLLLDLMARLGGTLFTDGDLIQGCQPVINAPVGELIGTGTGSRFSWGPYQLLAGPFVPGTLKIVAAGQVATDDGAGNITGAGGITGTVTNPGVVNITYTTAPLTGVQVLASYTSAVITMSPGRIWAGGRVRVVDQQTVTLNGVGDETIGVKLVSTENLPLADAPPAWQEGFAYVIGNLVSAVGNALGYYFQCTVAGTSGSVEPTWNTTPGVITSESGTLRWTRAGYLDPSLGDPAVGFDNYQLPGAWRAQITPLWIVNDATLPNVFRFSDGVLLVSETPTQFTNLEKTIGRYIYESLGNYRISGLTVTWEPVVSDSSNVNLMIAAGTAFVQGQEVVLASTNRLKAPISIGNGTVNGEQIQFLNGTELYSTQFSPIASITLLTMPIATTQNLTKGSGAFDLFPVLYTPVDEIIQVVQGATTYVQGVDYQLGVSSGHPAIQWLAGHAAPTNGTTYSATWIYAKTAVKGSRVKTTVTAEAVTRTPIATSASDSFAHADLITITRVSNSSGGANNYVAGTDYQIVSGRNTQVTGPGGVTWITGGSKPSDSATYYVDYVYWAHATEGDFVSADSYDTPVDIGSPWIDNWDLGLDSMLDFRTTGDQPYSTLTDVTNSILAQGDGTSFLYGPLQLGNFVINNSLTITYDQGLSIPKLFTGDGATTAWGPFYLGPNVKAGSIDLQLLSGSTSETLATVTVPGTLGRSYGPYTSVSKPVTPKTVSVGWTAGGSQTLAIGNGVRTAFGPFQLLTPVVVSTVALNWKGVGGASITVTDDGAGSLINNSAVVVGTINYTTGVLKLNIPSGIPGSGKPINLSYHTTQTGYDDGLGKIWWNTTQMGTIVYETGVIYITLPALGSSSSGYPTSLILNPVVGTTINLAYSYNAFLLDNGSGVIKLTTVGGTTEGSIVYSTGVLTLALSLTVPAGVVASLKYKRAISLTDDGAGHIVNGIQPQGTIEYLSGLLNLNLGGIVPAAGSDILASYIYATPAIVVADYEYWTPRFDDVVLGSDGRLSLVEGTPGIDPQLPLYPGRNLPIAYIKYQPIPITGTNSGLYPETLITTTYPEIQNYTMSMIHGLDDRITQLEDSTTLSLLENLAFGSSTPSTKLGILTDSFTNFSAADPFHPLYSIAYDLERGVARIPAVATNQDPVIDTGSSTVVLKDQIVVKSYTEQIMLQQPYNTLDPATSNPDLTNVNPYDVFSSIGHLILKPSVDYWVDTTVAPSIFIDSTIDDITNLLSAAQQIDKVGYAVAHIGYATPGDFVYNGVYGWWKWPWHNGPSGRIWNLQLQKSITTTNLVSSQAVETGLVPFLRKKTVAFSGLGWIPGVDLAGKFDGKTVALTATGGSTAGVGGGTIRCESTGFVSGTFQIPAKVQSGVRTFVLSGGVTGGDQVTGQTNYSGQGRMQTVYNTYDRVTTQYYTADFYDPVAASFVVPGSVPQYVTSVDLYFTHKDASIPVTVSIRDMANGFPGQSILGEVTLLPANVHADTTGMTATTFTFPDPILLNNGQNYCWVVSTSSDAYIIAVATLGHRDSASKVILTKNPSVGSGVMFTSENGETWTPNQFSDPKYTIRSASFNPALQTLLFNNLTGLSISAFNLQSTQVIPAGAGLQWYYSIDAGATYIPFLPGGDISLSQLATQLKLRCDFTGVSSPEVNQVCNLITLKSLISADYVSVNVQTLNPITTIRTIIDASLPAGTAMTPYYSLDGGATWVLHSLIQINDLNGGNVEYTYEDTLTHASLQYKIRYQLTTGDPCIQPIVGDVGLRSIAF